jgi:hypothetical protein
MKKSQEFILEDFISYIKNKKESKIYSEKKEIRKQFIKSLTQANERVMKLNKLYEKESQYLEKLFSLAGDIFDN